MMCNDLMVTIHVTCNDTLEELISLKHIKGTG